jgi:hypothetical protein
MSWIPSSTSSPPIAPSQWKEIKESAAAAIEELRYHTSVSRSVAEEKLAMIEKWKASGHYSPVESEKMASYKEKCKKILRRIRYLTHSDTLHRSPAYARLGDSQKLKLRVYFDEALRVKYDELGYPQGDLNRNMRTLDGLLQAMSEIESILKEFGIEIGGSFVITGETIKEKLAYLRIELTNLDLEFRQIQAQLKAMIDDAEIKWKLSALSSPAYREQIITDFQRQAREYREKASQREQEIAVIWGVRS